MTRTSSLPLLLALALLGCDRSGTENARGPAVPKVAPPKLSPIELLPPVVNRQTVGQVVLADPLALASFQNDLFVQGNGVVDILWIIDDSGSMADQRLVLGQNFSRFLTELEAVKSSYHIGVVTTNAIDFGALIATSTGLKIITNSTPNAQAAFIELTTFPPSRARWEQGLRMGELALIPPNSSGPNAGFLRANAALAAIVVSNEDDGSYGDPGYYVRFFRGSKGAGNERLVTFSTIAGTLPDGCVPPADIGKLGGAAEPAFRYSAVSFPTAGVVGSICDTSFEATLVRIVDGVTIPQDVVNGWQYQASTNSVTFLGAYVPLPGAQIQILYAIAN